MEPTKNHPARRLGQDRVPVDTLRRPIHDLRISVMDRCNFRCPYCMPRETFHESYRFLKSNERLDFAEMLRLARVFVRAGVKKLRITGGEPLLRPNLADLIGDLTSLPGIEDIALTTNGMLLAKYATELKAAGLQAHHREPRHARPGHVREDERRLRRRRRSARRHRARAARGPRAHQDQHRRAARRQRPHRARPAGAFPRHRRHRALHRVHGRGHAQPLEPRAGGALARARGAHRCALADLRRAARDYRGEVAERHAFEDGAGEVGFISSVSQPFCGDCSRARISSDGSFYTCLFATQGMDLRGPLRAGATDDELFELIRGIWTGRATATASCAPRCATPPSLHKVEMNYIGG